LGGMTNVLRFMCNKTLDICGGNRNNVQYKAQQFRAAAINNTGYISYRKTEITPSFALY